MTKHQKVWAWCKTKWTSLKKMRVLHCLTNVFITISLFVFIILLICFAVKMIFLVKPDTADPLYTALAGLIGVVIGGLKIWQRSEHQKAEHVQERLKTSIEHLGDDKAYVRTGAAYELYHLAKDYEDYRETVCHILCGHIRQTTQETNYQKQHANKPSEEIQTFLNLLCGKEKGKIFNSYQRDLNSSFLKRAILDDAQLRWANLWKAKLQRAGLRGAQLQGAILYEAQLQAAELGKAQLQVADLRKAQLQAAGLRGAQLQGAKLEETNLQGVSSSDKDFYLTFQKRIEKYTKEDGDFTEVIFSGGLSKGQVNEIIASMPPDLDSDEKEKLAEELNRGAKSDPCNARENEQLLIAWLKDRRAKSGPYSAEEAEQWIKEYDKPVESAPKEQLVLR